MTAAKKLVRLDTYFEAGKIERTGEILGVRLSTGIAEARRAKSCLVVAEVGDTVLCAVSPEDVFVLAVLEGRRGASTKLAADGDLDVQARGGRVAISASSGIDLVTPGEVAVNTADLSVFAKKGSVSIEELGYFGRLVQAEVDKLAVIAREVDSVVARLTQRAKRVFRFIEDIDQTRAGTVDLRAQGLIAIRGENAIVSARVLAKVDGEQIHIG